MGFAIPLATERYPTSAPNSSQRTANRLQGQHKQRESEVALTRLLECPCIFSLCHSQAPTLPQGCLHQGENNGIAGSPINTARQKPVNRDCLEMPPGSRWVASLIPRISEALCLGIFRQPLQNQVVRPVPSHRKQGRYSHGKVDREGF
jgi:hypothetical protein